MIQGAGLRRGRQEAVATRRDCYPFRMPDARLPTRERRAPPGAQFRCLPCRRLVTATELGTCPRCSWAAPTLLPAGPRRAAGLAALGSGYWLAAAALSAALGIAAAALALGLW